MSVPLQQWIDTEVAELKKLDQDEYFDNGFFRDPVRPILIDGDHFYSPADGTILYQKEVEPDEEIVEVKGVAFTVQRLLQMPDYNRRVLVIGIFLSMYDLHIARLPYSGILRYKKLDAIETKNRPMLDEENNVLSGLIDYDNMGYAFTNERWIETVTCPQINYKYHMVTIADQEIDVIQHITKDGNKVIQNSRIAKILHGSQMDLILPMPLYYELLVPTGYHVKAGVDKLVKIISKVGYVQKQDMKTLLLHVVEKAGAAPGTVHTHADGTKWQKQSDGKWKRVVDEKEKHEPIVEHKFYNNSDVVADEEIKKKAEKEANGYKKPGGHWGSSESTNIMAKQIAFSSSKIFRPIDKIENNELKRTKIEITKEEMVDAIKLRNEAQERMKKIDRNKYPEIYRGMTLSEQQIDNIINKKESIIELTGCTAFTFSKDIMDHYSSSAWTKSFGKDKSPVKITLKRNDKTDASIGMWHNKHKKKDQPAFEILSGLENIEIKKIETIDKRKEKEEIEKEYKDMHTYFGLKHKHFELYDVFPDWLDPESYKFYSRANYEFFDNLIKEGIDFKIKELNRSKKYAEGSLGEFPSRDESFKMRIFRIDQELKFINENEEKIKDMINKYKPEKEWMPIKVYQEKNERLNRIDSLGPLLSLNLYCEAS